MANKPVDRPSSRVTPKGGASAGAPVTKAAARKAAAEDAARQARSAEVAAKRASVSKRPRPKVDPEADATIAEDDVAATETADGAEDEAPTTSGWTAARAATAPAGPKAAPDKDRPSRPAPPKVTDTRAAARSGNPKKKAEAVSARYTPPTPNSFNVSPWYIPALMFGFLGLGMIIIFLNYMGWPFGDPSNWRLLGGLGCILAGILVATRYQ